MKIFKLLLFFVPLISQNGPAYVDGVAAIIEDNIILKSDVAQMVNITAAQSRIDPSNEPDKFLNKALHYLKPGGTIYIEVPNANALKVNGKNSEEFFIEHLHVFSLNSLKNLIIRQKVSLILLEEIKEPSGKFTLFAFAKKN